MGEDNIEINLRNSVNFRNKFLIYFLPFLIKKKYKIIKPQILFQRNDYSSSYIPA